MFLSLILAIVTLSASANAEDYTLTCEEYDYLVDGLSASVAVDDKTRSEIRFELIKATDPSCFRD